MCDIATEPGADELTPCEWCLTPFFFVGHPQLCVKCLGRFHEAAREKTLVDITKGVYVRKVPEENKWNVLGESVKGASVKDLAFIQVNGAFRVYRIHDKV